MPGFTVASFNVHAGVDGWGRPHDVLAVCRRLDADVLVIEEDWRPDGGEAVAEAVAGTLGYRIATATMSRTRISPPPADAPARWGPRPLPGRVRALRSRRSDGRGRGRSWPTRPDPPGSRWGDLRVAVLTRLPVAASRLVDLGRLPRDAARRAAVVVQVVVDGVPVTVAGTHVAHLTAGSPVQFRRLRRALPGPPEPVVLAGDMNLWGPVLVGLFPGWRRAVRGRTWLAWRRVAQLDHILVTPAVDIEGGEVVRTGGSDHLPVRARLRVAAGEVR